MIDFPFIHFLLKNYNTADAKLVLISGYEKKYVVNVVSCHVRLFLLGLFVRNGKFPLNGANVLGFFILKKNIFNAAVP